MNQKYSIDVKQFAELFDCEESTAYGVLRFLAEKGLVETTKRPQPIVDGMRKKGKPATLYLLSEELGARVAALLVPKISKLQPYEAPQPVVLAPEIVETIA
jgi:predicted transcriptional regulator